MRHILLVALTFFSLSFFSQIVFCPPGAEWRYSFGGYNLSPPPMPIQNVTIKYVRDSLIGNDTSKVLMHDRYFPEYNDLISWGAITLIKQVGDIVYFRNRYTKHNWEVLINYGATSGFCWQTTVWNENSSSIYTFCVDSVKYLVHNGKSLRTLYVNGASTFYITERFGANGFLFNIPFKIWSDGDFFKEFLCYKDDDFGTIQFTNKACDYSNPSGIIEQLPTSPINIFPNPSNEQLNFSFSENLMVDVISYTIIDNIGQKISASDLQLKNGISNISTAFLSPGVYNIHFKTPFGLVSKKFVKIN